MGMEMSGNSMMSGGMSPAEALLVSERNCGDGFGWGNNGMFVLFLFFLLIGGRGGWGGFGGGVGTGANFVNNDFLYTNLKNTVDNGFTQVANQQFATQKDIWQTGSGISQQMCNGFHGVESAIAESRFAAQNCCCETNRNIDAVRYENAKNTCDIINAIHADGEATRAQMTQNTIQELRDQLQAAQLQLGNLSQTNTLINAIKPCPVPAYPSCSPYQSFSWGQAFNGGCGCGCGC